MSTSKRFFQDEDDRVYKKQRVAVPSSVAGKIANLTQAVQEVLNHGDGADNNDMLDYMGKKAWEDLSELGYALNWKAGQNGMLQTYRANIPKFISALAVTPWKASEIPNSFPSLPQILDPTLETAAFTHQGMTAGRLGDLSYERLEWVGDTYLELTCTLLIAQTFPALLPGKCSQLRERCVKNVTLASYARHYGLDKRAQIPVEILNSHHPSKESDMTKIMGDIFEAYVAAVVLSDPANGIRRMTEWLKKLWGIELKKEILEAEKSGNKFDSPMWNLRGAVDSVEIRSSGPAELGPKDELQKLLGSKGIRLIYKDAAPVKKDRDNKLPLFTVGVYLNGYGKQDLQLGYGTSNGKKEAGKFAAEMALGRKKLMSELTDKKKLYEAQMEREKEALERFA